MTELAKTQASFDDPNLVSRAGLVPVMALAQRAGLAALAGEHVRPAGRCGLNAAVKVGCLVAGMIRTCAPAGGNPADLVTRAIRVRRPE